MREALGDEDHPDGSAIADYNSQQPMILIDVAVTADPQFERTLVEEFPQAR